MLKRFESKKIILLVVFTSVLYDFCFAQEDPKVDSLVKVLKTQKEDTGRVNTLNALSRRYSVIDNYVLSNKYAGDAILLATKLNFKSGFILSYANLGLNNEAEGNYPAAMNNFLSMLKYSEETGSKRSAAIAYNNIGLVYSDQGNTTEAIKNYLISTKICEETGDKRNEANAYYNIGNTYYSPLSNYPEAIKAHMTSLKLSKEIGDKPRVASRHIDIGNNYESLGNYPEAMKNYLAGLRIYEETGRKGGMASSYNNIGEIYNNQGNYPEAKKNYLAGLKLYQEIENDEGVAISYDNIGEIYQQEGNFDQAMKNHLAALKINEEIKYKYGMAYSYRNIGNTFFMQSKYTEALKNYLASLKLFKEMEENEGIAKIYKNIGEAYYKLNKFSESRQYFNSSLSVSKEIHGKKIMKECYEDLTRLDSVNGNWKDALNNHKLYVLYRDSLVNEENTNKITEMMLQYEFDKKEDSLKYHQALTNEKLKSQTLLSQQQQQTILFKEKELALISNEKQLQQLQIERNKADFTAQKVVLKAATDKKNGQLVLLNKEKAIQTLELNKQKQLKNYLLAGLVLFSILSFFIYRNYRTRQNLKLQILRNKIASDLHDDVGSTLSSISIFSQMAQQQSKEVIPLLETIEESSRKMLDAMADIVWSINPENDQFEKIILRMRSFAYELLGAKKIDFEFNADDDVARLKLSMDVRKNLYLIFKEATNNMVKYSGADKAFFTIRGEKDNLTMLIQDNGKGFDANQLTKGNGLNNMKKRAEEIQAQLMIKSFPGNGTTIQLSVAV